MRSIFNLLGPLANPARAPRQLLGVYASALVPVVAETLARLGTERALVVHGLEGLDEISPSGPTRAAWVEAGQVREVVLQPEDGGLKPVPRGALQGGDPGGQRAAPPRSARGTRRPAAGRGAPERGRRALGRGRGGHAGRGRAPGRGEHRLRGRAHPAGAPGRPDPGGRGGVTPGSTDGRVWRPPRGALAELVAGALEDCARRRRERPTLLAEVASRPRRTPRFEAALRSGRGFPLICEVKRASPSAGDIRAVDAPAQARAYVDGGARCVSVLTEERRFGGRLEDLRAVRSAVDVPLLRKDFVVEPHMLAEAVDAGADAVLLIAGAVEPGRLAELWAGARDLGLDVLLEVVQPFELSAPDALGATLVGVNARDLESLEVEDGRFQRLAPSLRCPGRLLVAESGIRSAEDVRRLAAEGADAALVGESVMRSLGPGGRGARAGGGTAVRTRVKVCGITRARRRARLRGRGRGRAGVQLLAREQAPRHARAGGRDRPCPPSRRVCGWACSSGHRPPRSAPPSPRSAWARCSCTATRTRPRTRTRARRSGRSSASHPCCPRQSRRGPRRCCWTRRCRGSAARAGPSTGRSVARRVDAGRALLVAGGLTPANVARGGRGRAAVRAWTWRAGWRRAPASRISSAVRAFMRRRARRTVGATDMSMETVHRALRALRRPLRPRDADPGADELEAA